MSGRVGTVVVLLGLLLGCAGDDAPEERPTTTDSVSAAAEPSDDDPVATTEEALLSGPPWIDAGLPAIELTTAHVGGGDRPVLAWEPVEDAASYVLVLRDGQGRTYWSWIGDTTSVPVGGALLPDTASGPRVGDDTTWAVMALDDDLFAVAVSEVRPIRP